jgi:hypothetical protein
MTGEIVVVNSSAASNKSTAKDELFACPLGQFD